MSGEATTDITSSEPRDQDAAETAESLGKRLIDQFRDDDLTGMAAEVAYHLIFAIPPLIILIVVTAALLNHFGHVDVVSSLQGVVDRHAPGDLKDPLDSVIKNAVGKIGGGAASLGALATIVVALWSGSNGIGSFIKGFNRAYDVDERRGFVKKRLVALGLTVAMIVFIIVSFALFVFGHEIGMWIAGHMGLGSAFTTLWSIGRWPVAVALIIFFLAILYYVGPSVEQQFRWVSAGSVVATLLWIAAVFGFKLYLAVSNPGSTYGAFGGLVVLLFFLYITSLVFLLGAEINAVLEKRFSDELAGAPETNKSTSASRGETENHTRDEGTSERDGRRERSAARDGSRREPT